MAIYYQDKSNPSILVESMQLYLAVPGKHKVGDTVYIFGDGKSYKVVEACQNCITVIPEGDD